MFGADGKAWSLRIPECTHAENARNGERVMDPGTLDVEPERLWKGRLMGPAHCDATNEGRLTRRPPG